MSGFYLLCGAIIAFCAYKAGVGITILAVIGTLGAIGIACLWDDING